MSLTAALGIAQNSLFNTSRQTSVVARNISEASNTDYSRRTAVLTSMSPGARIADIQRATNDVLFRQNLSALSGYSGQTTFFSGLDRLALSVNGVENQSSPARAIGDLQQALQFYSASPSNRSLAIDAVGAAHGAARSLNDASAAVQSFRRETDGQIAAAVSELNTLLAQFHEVNNTITNGTRAGRDVNDALDQRDAILKQISGHVSISTISRADNDLVIMTGDGVTLFETVPRKVTFAPTTAYAPGVSGNPVMIDGVPVSSGDPGSGSLSALVHMRDGVAVDMQVQLDEMARGLIVAFAETDRSGGGGADLAGLFTWPGAPALPPAGTAETGLAGLIRVNAAFDASAGGDPFLLRDGGANGADYVANTSGGASFATLLLEYGDRLDQPIAFDPAAGLGGSAKLGDFSTSAISWLEVQRQSARNEALAKDALVMRTGTALSNATGVNIDEEMALLLDLEHSYQASARIITAVDQMLAALLAAVR